jgi:alternate signal-mediated exported protein
MKARRHVLLLALVALVVATLVGGTTYALWAPPSANAGGGVVRTGDTRITLAGPAVWTETSPDVTPSHVIGSSGGTAAHRATAGDSFTFTQPFTIDLDGDNLAARLGVTWATPPNLIPAGAVTASYVVTSPGTAANPQGVSTAPAPLGTPATLPQAPASFTPADVATWGGKPWTLTVTVAYTGTSAVVVTPGQVADAPAIDLGTVNLDLRQVRDGNGFTS